LQPASPILELHSSSIFQPVSNQRLPGAACLLNIAKTSGLSCACRRLYLHVTETVSLHVILSGSISKLIAMCELMVLTVILDDRMIIIMH
jgi:hypothetical protein